MDHWYCLHVRANAERTVETTLAQRSVEAFYPSFTVKSRRRPGEMLRKPFFPGYVFGRFDAGDLSRRHEVIVVPHVVRLLGDLRGPLPLSELEVDSVRRVSEVAAALKAAPCPFVNVGDRVLVVGGPLAGVEGYVAYLKNSTRLILSVEMLHRSISAEVDASLLERVGAPLKRAA